MSRERYFEQLHDRIRRFRFPFVSICLGLPCAILALGCGGQSSDPQFVPRVFVAPTGEKHRYLVFLPRDFSSDVRRPLLMFLNGAGEDGEDGFRQIRNNFGYDVWRMRDVLPFVIVAPQRRGNANGIKKSLSDEAIAMAILDEVARDYRTDPDRMYLTGVSNGGSRTWKVASAFSDRFAAIVPMCGSGGSMTALSEANVPVWSFWNDDDGVALVQALRNNREQLIQLGRSPRATEYRGEGHDCWTRGYAHAGMFEWLLHQSRAKNQREDQRFTPIPPEAVLNDWARRGNGTWAVSEHDVLVCRGATPGEENAMVSPPVLENGEVHVDAKWDMGTTLSIGLYVQNNTSPGLVISVPHADAGVGGLWIRDEDRFMPLNPVGQRYLHTQGWNDLRVSKQDGVLSFSINGISSLQYRNPQLSMQGHHIGLLAPCSSEKEICWRYLRWRFREDQSRPMKMAAAPKVVVAEPRTGSQHSKSTATGAVIEDSRRQIETAWLRTESLLTSGELRWTISTDQFHLLGLYPLPPVANDQDAPPLHRLVLDQSRWRYDGWQPSEIAIGFPRQPMTRKDRHKLFMALVDARMLPEYKPTAIVHSSTIWNNAERKVSLWRKNEDEYSRVLIEPASAAKNEAGSVGSSTQERLGSVLLDAVLLSVRPMSATSLSPRLNRCELVEPSTFMRGQCALVVLSEKLAAEDTDESPVERRYWLDPDRNCAVRRVVESRVGKPTVQVDVQYANDDNSQTLPTSWYALALDENGDVSQFVRAERRGGWIEHCAGPTDCDGELPADTWVVDRTTQQSYIAKADESRLELNGREYEPGASFAQLLSEGEPSWLATLWTKRSVRQFFRSWLTLPGILLAALVSWSLGAVFLRVIRLRRAVNHSDDAIPETMRGHV